VHHRVSGVLLLCLALILSGCGGSTAPAPTTAPSTSSVATSTAATPGSTLASTPGAAVTPGGSPATASGPRTKVTLQTGFLPSMNSAPFYLALQQGYYAAEGLDVTIQDGSNPDLLKQVGSGGVDFGISGGDSVIPARAAGVPVVMVMQQFQQYPVGLITLAGGGVTINKPADLKGKKIGVSAPNGSTYFGLLALLKTGNLTTGDVQIISIGFTELEALTQKRVDAAMTFVTNEPVQAKALGFPVNQMNVSDYANLVSTGLVTSDRMVQQHPDVVQRFVNASLRGLVEAQRNPEAAYQATIKRMPELSPADATVQRDVLTATLTFEQQPSGHPYGWSDPAAWSTTVEFLKSVEVVTTNVDPTACYTNTFVDHAAP